MGRQQGTWCGVPLGPPQHHPCPIHVCRTCASRSPLAVQIYIQYQGMIKHTLMALSAAGSQADVDIIQDLYQEDWWLNALLANDVFHGVWHRQFFSHNYGAHARGMLRACAAAQ